MRKATPRRREKVEEYDGKPGQKYRGGRKRRYPYTWMMTRNENILLKKLAQDAGLSVPAYLRREVLGIKLRDTDLAGTPARDSDDDTVISANGTV
jgi:hypothetical protein